MLHIDEYKNEVGEYVDPEGAHWSEPCDFYQGYYFKWCCCGMPEENLMFIRDVLRHIHNLKEQVWEKKIQYDEWAKQGKKIGSDQVLYFAYYVLDEKELTEHGGSVPGWLTDKGIKVLEDLEKIFEADDAKQNT